MRLRKFIVEMGIGIDQHGQDPTNAARKAVRDAISRSCLCGIVDIACLDDVDQMVVEILVACPHPVRVDPQQVLQAVPFGRKRITVVEGGMIAPTIYRPELGDTTEEAYVANAAVTVYVDMDRVLEAWQDEP
jgi:uncharacterized protein (TIGR02058 family)